MNLNSTEQKIMEFFFKRPAEEFYEKEIREAVKVSAGAANMHLKKLTKNGFLLHRKVGRMNFYRLNYVENALVRQLKKAHTLSFPLFPKIKEAFKDSVVEIYLYGSTARGEDTEKSDLDMLVIGNIELNKLEKQFSGIRKISEKEIKLAVFSRRDWISMAKKDPAFHERVEKDKIRIV